MFTRPHAIAAAMGFIGILIISRPHSEIFNKATIAAGLAALGCSGSIMPTQGLTSKWIKLSILFIMTLMQLGFGNVCVGFDFDIAGLSKTNFNWVITIEIAVLLADLCPTTVLCVASETVLSPIDFLRFQIVSMVGYVLFKQTVDQYLI